MTVVGSLNGSTTFFTFDSLKMVMNWFSSINRVAETFIIDLSAKITNLNAASPFIANSTFLLDIKSDPCLTTSWDEKSLILNETSLKYT